MTVHCFQSCHGFTGWRGYSLWHEALWWELFTSYFSYLCTGRQTGMCACAQMSSDQQCRARKSPHEKELAEESALGKSWTCLMVCTERGTITNGRRRWFWNECEQLIDRKVAGSHVPLGGPRLDELVISWGTMTTCFKLKPPLPW